MNKTSRRETLKYLGAMLATLPAARLQAQTKKRPNILLVLADDMGWTDLGCYGNTYHETPNIDKLCAQRVKFTQAYASAPNCAPSRACLMTGQYVTRHGIFTVSSDDKHPEAQKTVPPKNLKHLPLELKTIADELSAAGYFTGYCGKWHLGYERPEKNISDYHPSRRGFQRALQTRSPRGDVRYFHPGFWTIPPREIEKDTYLTDYINDYAMNFLDEAVKQDKPFFMYLPHFAVHGPLNAKKETIAKYEKKKKPDKADHPIYAAMHEHLDNNMGKLLKKLDDLELADNTIVIFYSDNGGHPKFSNAPPARRQSLPLRRRHSRTPDYPLARKNQTRFRVRQTGDRCRFFPNLPGNRRGKTDRRATSRRHQHLEIINSQWQSRTQTRSSLLALPDVSQVEQ